MGSQRRTTPGSATSTTERFVGIDVSKDTLDVATRPDGTHRVIANAILRDKKPWCDVTAESVAAA